MSRKTLAEKLRSLALVTTASTGVFIGIGLYKNDDKFYDNIIMPIVQLLPPETNHRLAVLACKYNLFPSQRSPDPDLLKVKFLGHTLNNPIGIAAGFDKQGESVHGLHRIGFGFVEVGSVTPVPQPGNPQPRVFRLLEDKAIINRYGFNSEGHDEVFKRLKIYKDTQQSANEFLGINLGKNKTSDNAVNDYVDGIKKFSPIADYFVINISSPNTPGLRDMQNKEHLRNLLINVKRTRDQTERKVPILLKLAPDLTDPQLKDVINVIQTGDCRIDGLIISNTTIERYTNLKSNESIESGGLSGKPLIERSTQMIADVYRLTKGKIPIIGVGGVFDGRDAYEKILAGATVIQIYTSFIYHGPPVIQKIKTELAEYVRANGYGNISEAVGRDANLYIKK